MQTWLDAFASKCATNLVEGWAVGMHDVTHPLHRHMPPHLKAEVARLAQAFKSGKGPVLEAAQIYTLGYPQIYHNTGYPLTEYARVSVGSMINTLNVALPFVFGLPADVAGYDEATQTVRLKVPVAGVDSIGGIRPSCIAPVAVKVDRDLIDDLFGARAPASGEIDDEIRKHVWYFDLPAGAIRMSAAHEVRALFVCQDRTGVSLANAIYCAPGKNAMSHRSHWALLVDPGVHVKPQMTPPSHEPDFDSELAIEQLSDLIRLLVAYRMVAKGSETVPVPHLPARQLAADRNWRQKAKRFSLFRVNELRPPADRFGRAERNARQGWDLGWQTEVKGHFRWQPHGPRSSLRKLIWIDGFLRGPADAPHKRGLERLSSDQSRESGA